jgi:hypothetical protein
MSAYSESMTLSAGKTVLEKYVASIPRGEWPKLMMMTLNRTTD